MIRRLLAAAALLLAGCQSGTSVLGVSLRSPSAVASYAGRTTKFPGVVRPYLAIAAFNGDELRIADPGEGKLVNGPGNVFPLSVPTAPGPAFLVSSRLGDEELDAAGFPVLRPDLLAVAPQQGSGTAASPLGGDVRVEVVATWLDEPRLATALTVDLLAEAGAAAADAQVLAMAAAPVPGVPGRARLFIGLSGARLAVVDFERVPGSADLALRRIPGAGGLPVPAAIVPLATSVGGVPTPFDPLALSPEPGGDRLFVATRATLGDRDGFAVHGVAQVTTAAAVGAWPAVGLDARAPTRLVEAGRVAERLLEGEPAACAAAAPNLVWRLEKARRTTVYAVLDEAACGPRAAIDCGIATLWPDDATQRGGIAPDPAGELSYVAPSGVRLTYREPIRIPGDVAALSLVLPKVWSLQPNGGDAPLNCANGGPGEEPIEQGVLRIGPGDGQWDSASLLAVASSTGRIYLVDASRYGVGLNSAIMRGPTRAGISAASVVAVDRPATSVAPNYAVLGVWTDIVLPSEADLTTVVTFAPGVLSANVRATPGYAHSDTWTVTWRGNLPGLFLQVGQAGVDQDAGTGARIWVASQVIAAGVPRAVVNVADPELGVRVGDDVHLDVTDAVCPAVPQGTGTVAAQLRARVSAIVERGADGRWPGGALLLEEVPGGDCTFAEATAAGKANPFQTGLTVRVPGLVMAGASFGYAGRPPVSLDRGAREADTFFLRWEPEEPLAAAAASGDRLAAERLAIVRRLRRHAYPIFGNVVDVPYGLCPPKTIDGGSIDGVTLPCTDWPLPQRNTAWDPLRPPPEDRAAFFGRFGWACRARTGQTSSDDCLIPDLPDQVGKSLIIIATRDGVDPWYRRPLIGGVLPRSVSSVDRSYFGLDGARNVTGAFTDDQVILFSPATAANDTIVFR